MKKIFLSTSLLLASLYADGQFIGISGGYVLNMSINENVGKSQQQTPPPAAPPAAPAPAPSVAAASQAAASSQSNADNNKKNIEFLKSINSQDNKESGFSGSIKYGYYSDEYRGYIAYAYNNHSLVKPSSKNEEGGFLVSKNDFYAGTDYTPIMNESFRFLVGGLLGVSNLSLQEYKTSDRTITQKYSKNANLLLGARFGAIFNIGQTNDIEFAYQIDKVFLKNIVDAEKKKHKFNTFTNSVQISYIHKF